MEQLLIMPTTAIAAYSDGSQLNSQTGWGAASFYKGKVQESYGNMVNAEVIDAEFKGAKEALRLICKTTRRNAGVTETHLFLTTTRSYKDWLANSQSHSNSSSGRPARLPAQPRSN